VDDAESRLTAAPELESWLEKASVAQNKLRWQRRYFVLNRTCVFYYKVEDKHEWRMDQAFTVVCDDSYPSYLTGTDTVGYTFQVEFQHGGLLALATHSHDDLLHWVTVLRNLSLAMSAPLDAPADYTCERKGNLWVQTPSQTNRNAKKWRYYHFQLKDFVLKSYHREDRGFFPLANSTLSRSSQDEMQFYIRAPAPKKNYLRLRADSKEIMEQWLAMLGSVIKSATADPLTGHLKPHSESEHKRLLEYHNLLAETLRVTPRITAPRRERRPSEKYYILSIDGGGLRGLINCILLERLSRRFPDFLEKIDFVCGTSNGAMVSMGIAFGWSPSTCRKLIELSAPYVFHSGSMAVKSAKYSNRALKLFCDSVWRDLPLSEARTTVLVPALLLDNERDDENRSCEVRFFHNVRTHTGNFEPVASEKASDVIMRTAAAPTYFPSFQQYVDGGMFAHDPASCALTFAQSKRRLGIPLEDIVLLSMGTGHVNHFYADERGHHHNWGYVQWVPKLTTLLWDSMVGKSEMICEELLGTSYHRVNPLLSEEITMDDPKKLPVLADLARHFDLTATIQWIEEHFYPDPTS